MRAKTFEKYQSEVYAFSGTHELIRYDLLPMPEQDKTHEALFHPRVVFKSERGKALFEVVGPTTLKLKAGDAVPSDDSN